MIGHWLATPVGRVTIGWCLLSGAFGFLVGAAELLTRYRDEPFRTLRRRFGIAYLAVNGCTSFALCVLLGLWKDSVFPEFTPLSLALVSGFGAMALLRSKFLTLRSRSDEEIPIGLDVVVRAFLTAVDRGIDRDQADERWAATYAQLRDVADEDTLAQLLATLATNLRSYQNVSEEELEAFDATIRDLTAQTVVHVGLRAVAAGLAFQEIAGSSNFEKVAGQFREQSKLPAAS